jgi:hypothetical protein
MNFFSARADTAHEDSHYVNLPDQQHRSAAYFSLAFLGFLVLLSVLFLPFYDWESSAPGPRTSPSLAGCAPNAELASSRTDVIPPLNSHLEEMLKAEHDQLDTAKSSTVRQTDDGLHESKLAAPAHLTPARLVDLRTRDDVRFHWDPVPGAIAYRVKAWQFWNSHQVPLIDDKTTQTEIKAQPRHPGQIYWQVTALDEAGRAGEIAGPLTVEQLRDSSREPAARSAESGN